MRQKSVMNTAGPSISVAGPGTARSSLAIMAWFATVTSEVTGEQLITRGGALDQETVWSLTIGTGWECTRRGIWPGGAGGGCPRRGIWPRGAGGGCPVPGTRETSRLKIQLLTLVILTTRGTCT